MSRLSWLAVLIALLLISPAHAASGTVQVVYAGSLVHLNEAIIGPVFSGQTGYAYQGQAAGSLAIANQIKDHLIAPDVVELADPAVNKLLMGRANGNYVSWYLSFARSELVVGFNPQSQFAPVFREAQKHRVAWYRPLLQKGLRLGRTDPNLDPKGYRTIFMARLAQRVYHLKNFEKRIFGTPENAAQIFPEEVLAARLLAGQLDAGIFYLSEARALHIPYVRLPAKVNLGAPRYARLYATQHLMTRQGEVTGSPILFTITIPRTVANPAGAKRFVAFVLGKTGRSLAQQQGLLPIKVRIYGNSRAVPPLVERAIIK